MIVCGWCNEGTEPGRCSHCGRDPALPWVQLAMEPPAAGEEHEPGGRPALEPSQVRERIRIASKELGIGVTRAALAEHLQISERTLGRWERLAR